ncbi:hypothetical protein M3936_15565 [Sutcliffiella horikoshii]|uniref:hypothetical protein n=1 Tax=Sutcliffiella horikoshii TaxID=79883 RepID=UPI00203EE549|nr:hypothetical protein [Sutcliffiella horikoshii]MCM3619006.1 hypothetical protein [Sutcliffiella horikoshii]
MYYYPSTYHQPVYYPRHVYFPVYTPIPPRSYVRVYPPVDPTVLTESAESMQQLMKEASIILQKLSNSKEFASEVMSAAQEGNKEKVSQLLESTGVHSGIEVSFNPDGIHLDMSSEVEGKDCCHLTITLRWG